MPVSTFYCSNTQFIKPTKLELARLMIQTDREDEFKEDSKRIRNRLWAMRMMSIVVDVHDRQNRRPELQIPKSDSEV